MQDKLTDKYFTKFKISLRFLSQNRQDFTDSMQNETLIHPSLLDQYLELILKNRIGSDEFIYVIRNPDNQDDPYDLKVIDFPILRSENHREYYTISRMGLCHYINNKPSESVALDDWLKDRETCYQSRV